MTYSVILFEITIRPLFSNAPSRKTDKWNLKNELDLSLQWALILQLLLVERRKEELRCQISPKFNLTAIKSCLCRVHGCSQGWVFDEKGGVMKEGGNLMSL